MFSGALRAINLLLVSFLDFSSSTPEDLATLSAACQAATFGIYNQNVLDETYRKAGKMDKEHFACKLEEEVPRMLDAVRPVLFTDGEEKTNIRAELYKLNVYGEHFQSTLRATCNQGSRSR
jgi:hypothetical protein